VPVDRELPLRLVLREPPAGVRFAMQRGPTATRELVPPSAESPARVTFDITVRVRAGEGGAPRFAGPFVHGPPAERFLYVNAGDHAGDAASPWSRRAKIRLDGIAAADVDAVLARPGTVLEGEIAGTSRDGGPVCATTPVLGGWRVVARG
jgi:hypothetical protein